jgi:isopenicillin N synthase-like dioxygenase
MVRFDKEVPREEQMKWKLHVPRDPEYDEPDDGIIRKDATDIKGYIHWRLDTEMLFSMHGIALTAWQRDWLRVFPRVYARCVESQYAIAQAMDTLRPGYGFAARYMDATRHNQHCIRILKYERREGTVAHRHTDRDALTDHLAESADGLHACRGDTRTLCPTPAAPGSTLFTGRQLAAITDGALPALEHEVDDTTGGSKERWAVVFFGKMRKDGMVYA